MNLQSTLIFAEKLINLLNPSRDTFALYNFDRYYQVKVKVKVKVEVKVKPKGDVEWSAICGIFDILNCTDVYCTFVFIRKYILSHFNVVNCTFLHNFIY